MNVMSNLIQGEADTGCLDKGDQPCSMEILTRVSWETTLALVCVQLFAPQANVLSQMLESDLSQNSDVMWYVSVWISAAENIWPMLFR